ncbi:MAG TPA: amidohydrolase family protein [Gemmatimonadaceae bacterium]|nr:amidohydrolase family protein [Gemmatimonadaceae bacterium]
MPRLTRTLGLALVGVAALRAGAQTVAITGGTVYPVSGPPITNGTVLMRDGRIVAVGAGVAVPADAQRIDATGKFVTPGIVNAATELSVVDIGAVAATRNVSARGREGIAAAFTVWDGLNPASILIPPARSAGITSVVIAPRGGLLSGQAAVLHLVEGTAGDMVMRSPVAMVGQIGSPQQANAQSRGELMMKLREVLDDARAYARRKADYERAQTRQFAASRLDLEALGPVLDGRLPLLLEVDRASDIESALKLARDYNLKLMISGAAEAWMVADKLAAARVPVLTGAMNNIPLSFSSLGTRQENAGLLRRAGVTVVIIGNAGGGDEEAFNVRNVRFEAGNAVAYGMTREDALRAITLTPAEVFGVADRVGSLQPGKDADVVIWSGDPFEFATQPEHVFIRGREVRGPTRQDLLEQRYKTLPPNYRQP